METRRQQPDARRLVSYGKLRSSSLPTLSANPSKVVYQIPWYDNANILVVDPGRRRMITRDRQEAAVDLCLRLSDLYCPHQRCWMPTIRTTTKTNVALARLSYTILHRINRQTRIGLRNDILTTGMERHGEYYEKLQLLTSSGWLEEFRYVATTPTSTTRAYDGLPQLSWTANRIIHVRRT
jgi:hypothetical protein